MTALLSTDEDEGFSAEADEVIRALMEQYPAYATADVEGMMARLPGIQAGQADEIQALFAIAHNVKGQGSAFGYDLMTMLGEEICILLRNRTDLSAAEYARLSSLVLACHTVLEERLTGDGGARGASLLVATDTPLTHH